MVSAAMVGLMSTAPSQLLSRPSQTSVLGCLFWLHFTAPAVHAVVPAAQTPCLPVLHAAPPPGLPLSTCRCSRCRGRRRSRRSGCGSGCRRSRRRCTPSCPPRRRRLARVAADAAAGVAVVDRAVAVVVEAVAGLGDRLHVLVAGDRARRCTPWCPRRRRPACPCCRRGRRRGCRCRPRRCSRCRGRRRSRRSAARSGCRRRAPPVHAVVPAAHTPCLPVLQRAPPPGLPLSTTPLQSLSRPSQVSVRRLRVLVAGERAAGARRRARAQTPACRAAGAPPPGLPLSIDAVAVVVEAVAGLGAAAARSGCRRSRRAVHAVVPARADARVPVEQLDAAAAGCRRRPRRCSRCRAPSHVSAVGLHVLRCRRSRPPVHAVVPAAQTPSLPVCRPRRRRGCRRRPCRRSRCRGRRRSRRSAARSGCRRSRRGARRRARAAHAQLARAAAQRRRRGCRCRRLPLQSLSRPSHVSAAGLAVLAADDRRRPVHAVVPRRAHALLAAVGSCAAARVAVVDRPSQSLSMPSQVSAAG